MGYTLNQDPNSGRWQLFFLDREGQRVRKSTKQTDKRKAVVIADELYRKFGDPTYRAAHEATLGTGAAALIEHLTNQGRSKETEEFYKKKLGHIYRIMGKDRSLATIDAKRVDAYIVERRQEGAKPYTISKELTTLRMLLKVARRRGEFDKEVSQVMPVAFATKYKPKERRLTIEETWALVRELPPGPSRYVAFVAATTARDAAVERAKGKHREGDFVRVFDFKTKRATRLVPLTRITRPFADYAFRDVKDDEHVVTDTSSVRHALIRACKRLKMSSVSPNDIRRSVAHWLELAGVPRTVVAGVMGHADTRMLDRVYGKLDPQELQKLLRSSLEGSWNKGVETKETKETPERETP